MFDLMSPSAQEDPRRVDEAANAKNAEGLAAISYDYTLELGGVRKGTSVDCNRQSTDI